MGNLGTSIAIGISKFSKIIRLPSLEGIQRIAHLENIGITVSSDNTHNIEDADVILTVKPYQVDIVLADILQIKNKTIASAVVVCLSKCFKVR
jgi:pyrroline-5-carboxylate reductase